MCSTLPKKIKFLGEQEANGNVKAEHEQKGDGDNDEDTDPAEHFELDDNSERNPLEIHLVIDGILTHLDSLQDLLSCRQVCRSWKDVATTKANQLMKSSKSPTLTLLEKLPPNTPDIAVDGLCTGDPTSSLLPHYINHLNTHTSSSSSFLVLPSFKLRNLYLAHPLLQQFFNEHGQHVTKLTLNLTSRLNFTSLSRDSDSPRSIPSPDYIHASTFRQLLLQCDNLEELVFHHIPFTLITRGFRLPQDNFRTKIKRLTLPDNLPVGVTHMVSLFLKDLMASCPLLHAVTCKTHREGRHFYGSGNTNTMDLHVLKSIGSGIGPIPHNQPNQLRSARSGPSPLLRIPIAITELELNTVDNPIDKTLHELLLHSQSGKFRLKTLTFGNLRAGGTDDFTLFMNTQTDTLKSFVVRQWKTQSAEHQVTFPVKMGKLVHLEINISTKTTKQINFTPVCFSSQFPSLKSLVINGFSSMTNSDSFFYRLGVQSELERLFMPMETPLERVLNAGRIFPNVKEFSLRGGCGRILLPVISQWPELVSLHLDIRHTPKELADDIDLDFIITGVGQPQAEDQCLSKDQIQILPATGSRVGRGKKIKLCRRGTGSNSNYPAISKLLNLRELTLLTAESHFMTRTLRYFRTEVSDRSIHEGLCKLSSLQYLHFNNHKFSTEGVQVLLRNRDLVEIAKKKAGVIKCQKENLPSDYQPHQLYAKSDK